MSLPSYVISVDLGQAHDFTALSVLSCTWRDTGRTERVPNVAKYFQDMPNSPNMDNQPWEVEVPQTALHVEITHMRRLPLGTSYAAIPDVVREIDRRVRERWAAAYFDRNQRGAYLGEAPVELVIDATGVGRPVLDMLRAAGITPIAITIHGGDQVIKVRPDEFRVPKRDIAGQVQRLLQQGQLEIADQLPNAATLRQELANFRAKISVTGNDSYGAGDDWRVGNNDDLVLSVAIGAWIAEHAEANFPAVALVR